MYTPRQGRRKSIFIELFSDESGHSYVGLTSRKYLQLQPGELVENFLAEVDFDEETSLAHRWWPLGRHVPVVLDPAIAFGAPVIDGTGVKTEVAAGLAERTTIKDAAGAYQVSLKEATAAIDFERQLRAA